MTQGDNERYAQAESGFVGYQVYDRHYEKVGRVYDLFVDENDRPEYIGVKTGFFDSRSTLIPVEIIRVNDERRLVEVNSEMAVIKDGPTFGSDDEITAGFEGQVYAHFGLKREETPSGRGGYGEDYRAGAARRPNVDAEYGERAEFYDLPVDAENTAPESASRGMAGEREGSGVRSESDASYRGGGTPEDYADREARSSRPGYAEEEQRDLGREERGGDGPGMRMGDTETGEFRRHGREQEGVRQPGGDLQDRDEMRVQRSEEELRVGTREREAGSVNVRKRVRVDREQVRVPTRREEVTVQRVPVEGREAPEAEIGGGEVRMPVVEDEVVVEKRPVVKEDLRIRKDVVEGEEVVEEDVRREEVDVIDETTRRGDVGGSTERRNR